jgi:hypothetical protein
MRKIEKYEKYGGDLDSLFKLIEYRPFRPSKNYGVALTIDIHPELQKETYDPFINISYFESVSYEFICMMIEDYPTLFSQRTISNINELESKHTGVRARDRYDRLPLYMIYFSNTKEAEKIYQGIKLNKEVSIENKNFIINGEAISLSDYNLELMETLLAVIKENQYTRFSISYDEINDVMNFGTIVKNKIFKNHFEEIRRNFKEKQINDFFGKIGSKSLEVNFEYFS